MLGIKIKRRLVFSFTLYSNCVSWKSHLQYVVALSTIEAEQIAVTKAAMEAIWLKGLLKELCVFK